MGWRLFTWPVAALARAARFRIPAGRETRCSARPPQGIDRQMRVDARAGARRMSHVCLAFLLVDRSAWLAGWLAWGVVKDGSKERPRETGNSLRRSIWGRGGRAGWCIAPNYSLCGSSAGYSSSLHWVSPITRGTVRSVPESSYPLCWALWDPQAGHHHHRGQTSWQSSHDDEDICMAWHALHACASVRCSVGSSLMNPESLALHLHLHCMHPLHRAPFISLATTRWIECHLFTTRTM